MDEIKTATLLNSTLSAEKFDALTLEVTSLTPQGGKWSGRVDVKVRLIMNDLSSLDELQMHPSMQTSLIRINPNPLSMVLMNPKVLEVRISLSPIQLRDILSHHMIDLPREAFYKVLKVSIDYFHCYQRLILSHHAPLLFKRIYISGAMPMQVGDVRFPTTSGERNGLFFE